MRSWALAAIAFVNQTPDAIARCSQAPNSLFILSLQLSPDTTGITITTNS